MPGKRFGVLGSDSGRPESREAFDQGKCRTPRARASGRRVHSIRARGAGRECLGRSTSAETGNDESCPRGMERGAVISLRTLGRTMVPAQRLPSYHRCTRPRRPLCRCTGVGKPVLLRRSTKVPGWWGPVRWPRERGLSSSEPANQGRGRVRSGRVETHPSKTGQLPTDSAPCGCAGPTLGNGAAYASGAY